MFIFDKEIEAKNIASGTRRKLFPGSENMMIARLSFTAGTSGDLHAHPHEQMSYILKGKFRYQVGHVTKEVGEGDVVYLDLRHLGAEKLHERLPFICELAKAYVGVDPVT
ncbi:cupin domain-containing protein, partial [Providencia stuartii]